MSEVRNLWICRQVLSSTDRYYGVVCVGESPVFILRAEAGRSEKLGLQLELLSPCCARCLSRDDVRPKGLDYRPLRCNACGAEALRGLSPGAGLGRGDSDYFALALDYHGLNPLEAEMILSELRRLPTSIALSDDLPLLRWHDDWRHECETFASRIGS